MHVKLLEIYANRKDTQAFEQNAAKLKSLTNGAGPEWEKAAALGRSIDPQNGLYGGAGAAAAADAAPAAAAPALDFDLGGGAASPRHPTSRSTRRRRRRRTTPAASTSTWARRRRTPRRRRRPTSRPKAR